MGLYLDSGFINQEWIQQVADKNNISFIVEIGGRQVGKTYGTLDLLTRSQEPFILMRRTSAEMEFICNDINNPFTVFKDRDIIVEKADKYTGKISKLNEDGEHYDFMGSVMALSTIAKIRGFNGGIYKNVVFDEFIPENHVVKIKNEADAFVNAYITISGNRELNGEPPLRFWLLANSNNLISPILSALKIQDKIEEMTKADQEISILPERGVMIILPHSEAILNKRKDTAIFKAIDSSSKIAQMAFNNDFAYNDSSGVGVINLKEFKPIFEVADRFTFYAHKSNGTYFVGSFNGASSKVFVNTDRERQLVLKNYPNLRRVYVNGNIIFQNVVVKENFINFLYDS